MRIHPRLARSSILLSALFFCHAMWAPAAAQALPTVAELTQQPHPQIKIFEIAPVVQDFAPGQLSLKSSTLVLHIQRVTYTAQGVEIDAEAEQTQGSTGPVSFNHMHNGTLRDDTGTVLRLRDPKNALVTRAAKKGDRWKTRILTAGYLPPSANTMTLALHFSRSHVNPEVIEASWPVPDGVRAALRGAGTATVQSGKGMTYAIAPAANSPGGYLSMRVYRVQWLQDGIAIDFDARNTTHSQPTRLNSGAWALKLVDDQNRQYRVVQAMDLALRPMTIAHNHRMAGRLLFSPRIAADAKKLRLLTNFGPKGKDLWAPITVADDNMHAPHLALDLGIIAPQAMPAAAATAAPVLRSDQKLPPVFPTDVSTLDPIARLKQELGATEGAKGSTVDLPGDVLFDFDKASLRADAAPTLDKLSDLIRRVGKPVQVSGHTDSKGDAAYNTKLSVGRAPSRLR